ncbi:MAG: hypothetical protein ISN28_15460 [Ectothiorhodospiraceae bacterium AqS1]|nr:hypothetical protein [Ectothiorhodospiraceae bacterium AqS1]MBF2761629.1 hypothetical protein [Ectothiorhodospiraceae bacterium AqS1]
MAIDYDAIRKQNIKEYGEGKKHLEFLGRLYSDRTHFVYELLQNAEDKDATRVRLNLYEDRLEFLHDGTPFDKADIRGICGIGEGTKSDDLTKIGKFGIGFKSVYSYTSSPKIHCGDENFRIEGYVRPFKEKEIKISAPWTTKFIFPFKLQSDITDKKSSNISDIGPSITADKAYDEIAKRLIALNVRTLLFLRSIVKIEWETDKRDSGLYIRCSKRIKSARRITIVGNHNDDKEEETWLVFEKAINDPDGNSVKPIEIAYKIEKEEKKEKGKGKNKIKETESIVCLHKSPLFVFFATEKETGLGFLLQGPYRTTPARDNIPKDDPWNTYLMKKSAALVIESLRHLKSMKLLSVTVLEGMPIIEKNFTPDSMFRIMHDDVAKALMENEFLPTDTGGYTNATNAMIGRGDHIRSLLSSNQLTELFKTINPNEKTENLQWLSGGITENQTPELREYLIQKLKIDEITPEIFALRVTKYFFESQSDEWFVKLYRFLLQHESLWRMPKSRPRQGFIGIMRRGGLIRHKPFIRLEDNRQVNAFGKDGSIAIYLPTNSDRELPCIKKTLIKDNDAKEFFKRLGVTEPDIVSDIVEKILPIYQSGKVKISKKDHLRHITLITQSLMVDSTERRATLIRKLKNSSFLFAKNAATDEKELRRPEEIYLRKKDLEIFFEDNSDVWFLDAIYSKKIINDLEDLGINRYITVHQKDSDYRDYVCVYNHTGNHERGLNGFDPNCRVDHLDFAAQNPNIQRSLFIWKNIAYPLQKQFRGTVEKSTRKTYFPSEIEEIFSRIGEILFSSAWLPDAEGRFHIPSDLSLDDLPSEFERHEDLANQLRMKGSELTKFVQKEGITVDDLDFLKELKNNMPEEYERLKKSFAERKTKPAFPERASSNPDRRSHRVVERAGKAPKKKFEKRLRSNKTSSSIGDKKVYLREFYTNEEKLLCQICENVMPFRGRNEEYYFEAAQIFDDLDGEYEEMHIALCPLCAAKFRELIKKDEDQRQRFRSDLVKLDIETTDVLRIGLDFGEEKGSIRFVKTHLKVEGKGRKDPSS